MRFIFITYCFFLFSSISAQSPINAADQDTVYITDHPTIRNKYTGSSTNNLNPAESLFNNQNLAQLISNSTSSYVRSNGIGSTSTLSIRGGSSAHSLVMWNGIPVRNPMVGLSDISLINTNAFTDINLIKGGQSSIWGSGAIGGVVELNNENKDQSNSISSRVEIGSFGFQQWDQKLDFKIAKLSSSTSYRSQSAVNNFPTIDNSRTSNANLNSHVLNQTFRYQVDKRSDIYLHYWNSSNQRNIPPTINQNTSLANQEDKFHRLMVHYKTITNSGQARIKLAYFDETVSYTDPVFSIDNDNHFKSVIADIQYETSILNNHILLIGSSYNANIAETNNYEDTESENILALFTKLAMRWKKLSLDLSLRQEKLFGQALQFLPNIAAEYELSRNLIWKTKLSRNYRFPGMNDIFWLPGGNRNLLPESGWSIESGIYFNHKTEDNTINFSLVGFNRNIDNWILWSPINGSPFWSASNLNSVWSRGIELSAAFKKNLGFAFLNSQIQFDHIRSTSQKTIAIPRISQGDQIWYTPVNSFSAMLGLEIENFQLNSRINRTSSTQGFNGEIEAFTNIQLNLSYTKRIRNYQTSVFVSIDNLSDTNYFIIEDRPMPGRNYRFGLQLQLNP